jgi:hypothetical protein
MTMKNRIKKFEKFGYINEPLDIDYNLSIDVSKYIKNEITEMENQLELISKKYDFSFKKDNNLLYVFENNYLTLRYSLKLTKEFKICLFDASEQLKTLYDVSNKFEEYFNIMNK